ncbi:MAG TPA: endo-1,4-beta-xylanase, partial [Brevibacterium sp.]|nr:endo-1,4-beta-xylanase [Brevibacterium sp.]
MKRRQVLTATAVATAATLGTAATASAAPGHGEHTPPGLAKKDTLAWAAGGVIEIGSAVAGGGHHTEQDYPTPMSEEIYRETLGREVTSLSAENQMKWDYLRPNRETFDFEDADEIMDFAQQHGQVVRGHTLLWHAQNPTWLEEGDFSADELRDLLKEHIDTVVGRYRGRIQQWDVVNEIFTDEGELRLNDNIWL